MKNSAQKFTQKAHISNDTDIYMPTYIMELLHRMATRTFKIPSIFKDEKSVFKKI